jgi:hypothetical protein
LRYAFSLYDFLSQKPKRRRKFEEYEQCMPYQTGPQWLPFAAHVDDGAW